MELAEKVFGKRIKQLRKQHRLTQSELGEMVGLTQQSITAWETGRTYPDVYTLIRLAMLYEVSVDWLLGLTETSEPSPMLLRRSCGIRRENRWEWQLSPELRQAILELVRGEARETLQDPSIATQLSQTWWKPCSAGFTRRINRYPAQPVPAGNPARKGSANRT